MFGFSFLKLLVLLAIVAAVLIAYRYFGSRRPGEPRRAGRETRDKVEDLQPCPECGNYVTVGAARPCGRDKCPY